MGSLHLGRSDVKSLQAAEHDDYSSTLRILPAILAPQISRHDSAKAAGVPPISKSWESHLVTLYFDHFPFLQFFALRSPIMSSNVGLTTPRGSGTSGYVQRNLSHLKPRDNFAPYPKDYDLLKHRQRKPDKEILDHDRLREVEVKVFDLRDKLEDEGYVCP